MGRIVSRLRLICTPLKDKAQFNIYLYLIFELFIRPASFTSDVESAIVQQEVLLLISIRTSDNISLMQI